MTINIPPQNKIGFIGDAAIEYLTALGFEQNNLINVNETIKRPDGTDKSFLVSYFVNEDYADLLSVKSTRNVKFSSMQEANFTTFQRIDYPRGGGLKTMSHRDGVAVKFELLDREVSFGCSLTEPTVLECNRRFRVAFFEHILKDVAVLLQFTPDLLDVTPALSGTQLAFSKIGSPDKDEAVKFTIHLAA